MAGSSRKSEGVWDTCGKMKELGDTMTGYLVVNQAFPQPPVDSSTSGSPASQSWGRSCIIMALKGIPVEGEGQEADVVQAQLEDKGKRTRKRAPGASESWRGRVTVRNWNGAGEMAQ